LATVFGILWDKKRVMDNQPTSITQSASMDERLKKLADNFEQLAEKKANALEGQYKEVTNG
jgi:hypothetical protein